MWRAIVISLLAAGCTVDAVDTADTELATTTCSYTLPGVYSPYLAGHDPVGTVDDYPWGPEDFSEYTAPSVIECASGKGAIAAFDVTAGCLDAALVGAYARGQIHATTDGYFRAVALGYAPGDPHPVKYTDQGIEYRFDYKQQTGDAGNPGFKAFARYRTEDDLYVASWRTDGVVQIQKKQCGVYTPLAIRRDLPPPSAGAWHTIRFDAIGDQLTLTLDHAVVLQVIDGTFSWGTVGIRIDSMDGAYIDDWHVDD